MQAVVTLYDRQEAHVCDLDWLTSVANASLPLCSEHLRAADAPLTSLADIEVSIVTDAEIARVHADFMDDPTPTDVITFHHGEIIISADTAHRAAQEIGHCSDRELCLYVIHGLLHLAGWDDHEPQEAAAMKEIQERVLTMVAPNRNAPPP